MQEMPMVRLKHVAITTTNPRDFMACMPSRVEFGSLAKTIDLSESFGMKISDDTWCRQTPKQLRRLVEGGPPDCVAIRKVRWHR